MEKLNKDLIVFGGPSLPDCSQMQGVIYRAPIRRGDLANCSGKQIVLILDGLFLQAAAATHYEYLALLQKGVTLIGAASTGALRAVELRDFGFIGVGAAYRAFLSGAIVDDSELAVGICPLTYRALTVSLFDIRQLLAQVEGLGANADQIRLAFTAAQNIQFWERTRSHLLATWGRCCPRIVTNLKSHFDTNQWHQKKADAIQAIELGLALASGKQPVRILSAPSGNPVSLYTLSGIVQV